MGKPVYPKNSSISNGLPARLYLACLRRRWGLLSSPLGLLLSCEIWCEIPERLFLPHPVGIIVATQTKLANDVVLLQQVTLGCRSAYACAAEKDGAPIIEEGVYVGPGAKVLGKVTLGAWSIIGANAVITEDVPPYSIAVGNNQILRKSTKDIQTL